MKRQREPTPADRLKEKLLELYEETSDRTFAETDHESDTAPADDRLTLSIEPRHTGPQASRTAIEQVALHSNAAGATACADEILETLMLVATALRRFSPT